MHIPRSGSSYNASNALSTLDVRGGEKASSNTARRKGVVLENFRWISFFLPGKENAFFLSRQWRRNCMSLQTRDELAIADFLASSTAASSPASQPRWNSAAA
jgi:hypothetical protein